MVDYTAGKANDGSLGIGVYVASALIVAVLLFALFGGGGGSNDPSTAIAPDAIDGSATAAPIISE